MTSALVLLSPSPTQPVLLLSCPYFQDGYEIMVDEVDPASAAAAASLLQSSVVAAAEARLQDQLRSAAALAAEFQRSMGTSAV